jgi:hypothetical protein
MTDNVADSQQPALSDDLLWGTKAIAGYIGRSLTETQYLIRTGAITVARTGPKQIIGSKKQLRRDLSPKAAKGNSAA